MYQNAVVIGGLGVVGTATRRMLGIPWYYDHEGSNITMQEIKALKYVFLCVPTRTIQGRCDTTAIWTYFELLGKGHIYIIRSTVIPGTARKLAEEFGVPVVSNPEFLTEATAEVECLHPDIVVLGADDEDAGLSAWNDLYWPMKGSQVFHTDTITAEFIKYAVNTFYASKVVFANSLYEIAANMGIDYDVVRDALYARKWVGNNHLTVPWKGQRGLNGKCLPKDLEAFATFTGHDFFEFLVELNRQWAE